MVTAVPAPKKAVAVVNEKRQFLRSPECCCLHPLPDKALSAFTFTNKPYWSVKLSKITQMVFCCLHKM